MLTSKNLISSSSIHKDIKDLDSIDFEVLLIELRNNSFSKVY